MKRFVKTAGWLAATLLAAGLSTPALALADDELQSYRGVVHLKDGRTLVGDIIARPDGVTIKLAAGTVTLPTSEVVKIQTLAEAEAAGVPAVEELAAREAEQATEKLAPSAVSPSGAYRREEMVNYELGFRLARPDDTWLVDPDPAEPLTFARLVHKDGFAEARVRLRPVADAVFPPPSPEHLKFAAEKVAASRLGERQTPTANDPWTAPRHLDLGPLGGGFEFRYYARPVGSPRHESIKVIERVFRHRGYEWSLLARVPREAPEQTEQQVLDLFASIELLDEVSLDDRIFADRSTGIALLLPPGGFEVALTPDGHGLTMKSEDGLGTFAMKVYDRKAVPALADLASDDPQKLADQLEQAARERTSFYKRASLRPFEAREVVEVDGADVVIEDGVYAAGVELISREALSPTEPTLVRRVRRAFATKTHFFEIVVSHPAIDAEVVQRDLDQVLASFSLLRPDLVEKEIEIGLGVEKTIENAVVAFEEKRYQEAASAADAILADYPTDPTALRIRGFALLRLRELREAIEDLELVLDVEDDPEVRRALLQSLDAIGVEQQKQEQWPEVIETRERIMLLAPDSHTNMYRYELSVRKVVGQHLAGEKPDYDAAERVLEDTIEFSDSAVLRLDAVRLYVRWAKSLRVEGKLNGARTRLRRATQTEVDERDADLAERLIVDEHDRLASAEKAERKREGKSGLTGTIVFGVPRRPAVRFGGTQGDGSTSRLGMLASARRTSRVGSRAGRFRRGTSQGVGVMGRARQRAGAYNSTRRRGTQDLGRRGSRRPGRVRFVFR